MLPTSPKQLLNRKILACFVLKTSFEIIPGANHAMRLLALWDEFCIQISMLKNFEVFDNRISCEVYFASHIFYSSVYTFYGIDLKESNSSHWNKIKVFFSHLEIKENFSQLSLKLN